MIEIHPNVFFLTFEAVEGRRSKFAHHANTALPEIKSVPLFYY